LFRCFIGGSHRRSSRGCVELVGAEKD
jgi:hypothetical protein